MLKLIKVIFLIAGSSVVTNAYAGLFSDIGKGLDSAIQSVGSAVKGSEESEPAPQTNIKTSQHHRLWIDAYPPNSTIKIMNIQPKFVQGISLPAGSYDVLVAKPGYKSVRKMVQLKTGNKREVIRLSALKAQPVNKVPAAKKVDTSASNDNFYAGLVGEKKAEPKQAVAAKTVAAHFSYNTEFSDLGGNGYPEFDGGYIGSRSGEFVEMNELRAYTTKVVRGSSSISVLLKAPKTYYTVSQEGVALMDLSQFKGLVIKGGYQYKHFSLHHLKENLLSGNEGFFENKGPARKGVKFYSPGERINVRQKAAGNDGYYFQPAKKLKEGKYIAWIGNIFWIFKLK